MYMKQISTFIKGKNSDNKNYTIPKIIIQTYKNDFVHEKIYNNIYNILNINPCYDYYLITDDIGRSLIEKYFEKEVLNAFDKLNIGAAKGDFLRYVAIYIYGGIYIDLDSTITTNLNNIIDNNLDHYIIWDGLGNIMNTPIISKPNNPIILSIIKEVVKRINNYESNIFKATGPTVMTEVIFNDIDGKFKFPANIFIDKLLSFKRRKLLLKNENYKNGKIIHESRLREIQFTMQGYDESFLYSNNVKYDAIGSLLGNPTPFLYKYIHIGSSKTNTKTIVLNKTYKPDTKLVFLHKYKDTFDYQLINNTLIIKRTDKNKGWGQDLIAYL